MLVCCGGGDGARTGDGDDDVQRHGERRHGWCAMVCCGVMWCHVVSHPSCRPEPLSGWPPSIHVVPSFRMRHLALLPCCPRRRVASPPTRRSPAFPARARPPAASPSPPVSSQFALRRGSPVPFRHFLRLRPLTLPPQPLVSGPAALGCRWRTGPAWLFRARRQQQRRPFPALPIVWPDPSAY